jgi:three-Cys-motif partner protein
MARVSQTVQRFGGDWTAEKLIRVRKYLAAYMQIMKDRPYETVYIDAFAGTGYIAMEPKGDAQEQSLFTGFEEPESQRFLEGSARIALQIEPRFGKYIFIEKSPCRFAELEKLKAEFPQFGGDIVLENREANEYLLGLCQRCDWGRTRAVLFLDPFGMAVDWKTVEAVARTQAIDLWYLFPLGVAVNRLLKRDGQIKEPLSRRLDQIFGSHDWYDAFYQVKAEANLFGDSVCTGKVADFDGIGDYFVERLRGVFKGGVAERPLPLYSKCNIPLYLLCFAAGNPHARSATKIARHILRR